MSKKNLNYSSEQNPILSFTVGWKPLLFYQLPSFEFTFIFIRIPFYSPLPSLVSLPPIYVSFLILSSYCFEPSSFSLPSI